MGTLGIIILVVFIVMTTFVIVQVVRQKENKSDFAAPVEQAVENTFNELTGQVESKASEVKNDATTETAAVEKKVEVSI